MNFLEKPIQEVIAQFLACNCFGIKCFVKFDKFPALADFFHDFSESPAGTIYNLFTCVRAQNKFCRLHQYFGDIIVQKEQFLSFFLKVENSTIFSSKYWIVLKVLIGPRISLIDVAFDYTYQLTYHSLAQYLAAIMMLLN